MTEDLLSDVLVPVADVEDARASAHALSSYDVGRATVLHVVEKGEGVPDKTPVEQSESLADQSFAAFREVVPDADTEVTYAREVVSAILTVAREREASAIAFRPRGGSRLVQFLAGDRTLKLVTAADRPVLALPEGPDE